MVIRTFCGHCGTPLTYEAEDLPGEIHLLTGSADHPEAAHLAPQWHTFDNERISWVDLGAACPGRNQNRPKGREPLNISPGLTFRPSSLDNKEG